LRDLGWKGGTERDLVNFLGDMGLADKNVSDDQLMAEISKGINALESIAEENLKIAEQRIKKERASTAYNMASHNK
jgi:hypothetical protein